MQQLRGSWKKGSRGTGYHTLPSSISPRASGRSEEETDKQKKQTVLFWTLQSLTDTLGLPGLPQANLAADTKQSLAAQSTEN